MGAAGPPACLHTLLLHHRVCFGEWGGCFCAVLFAHVLAMAAAAAAALASLVGVVRGRKHGDAGAVFARAVFAGIALGCALIVVRTVHDGPLGTDGFLFPVNALFVFVAFVIVNMVRLGTAWDGDPPHWCWPLVSAATGAAVWFRFGLGPVLGLPWAAADPSAWRAFAAAPLLLCPALAAGELAAARHLRRPRGAAAEGAPLARDSAHSPVHAAAMGTAVALISMIFTGHLCANRFFHLALPAPWVPLLPFACGLLAVGAPVLLATRKAARQRAAAADAERPGPAYGAA
eukprot:TRINITY_DN37389_c0_g1_i1.p1 TRINITY_DN37389_c0_g1~~TRINITY_DN37389_c0_g1_i1.p1  ORF type:complete len:310 (+),score=103.90 TRINITY_DN37389_c0_g1_i1:64-930(+)